MKDKPKTIRSLDLEMKENAAKTDQRLTGVEESVKGLNDSMSVGFKELTEMFTSFKTEAKNRPLRNTKGVFSTDVYQHDDEGGIEFEKNSNPDADVEVVRQGISSVHSPEFKSKMEQLKFDEEEIEIMVMPSQSTFPDHTFSIGVNGVLRLIVRGTRQWLPRKYVEVLLRAKVSTYGNFEARNKYNDEMQVNNPETKSHRYPLQVITDRNPKGSAWLMRVTNDTKA